MLLTFIEQLGSHLDRRFVVAYWMPAFLAASVSAAIEGLLTDPRVVWAWWNGQSAVQQGLLVAGFLFLATILAYLLQAFTGAIVRFYEGYWPWWMTPLRLWKLAGQWRVLDGLVRKKNVFERHFGFPRNPERMLPTRLGNLLSAAEDYPAQVYGAEATVWWPRLVPFLPEALKAQLDGAATPMVALLNLSCLFGLLACGEAAAEMLGHRARWLLVPAASDLLLLAWFFYNAAVVQAVSYGQLVRVAFDLYRHEILAQMHVRVPDNPHEEWWLWKVLEAWVYANYKKPWEIGWPPPEPAPQRIDPKGF